MGLAVDLSRMDFVDDSFRSMATQMQKTFERMRLFFFENYSIP
jgi:hypothetical protein